MCQLQLNVLNTHNQVGVDGLKYAAKKYLSIQCAKTGTSPMTTLDFSDTGAENGTMHSDSLATIWY